MAEHINSKIVTIFRAGSFLSRAQGTAGADFTAGARMSIGAYFTSCESKRMGSGLSFEEEAILLPLVLDCDATDRQFRTKVSEYYNDMDTPIPFQTGKQFEIGLRLDNNKPLMFDPKDPSKSNLPIKVEDYIRFHHAKGHPDVAPSKEKADGSSIYKYYILDRSEVLKKNTKKNEERDAAMQQYLEIKLVPLKVDQMLTMLGTDIRDFSGSEADIRNEKVEKLKVYAEKEPERFTRIYTNRDLEAEFEISMMVNLGIMKLVAGKYVDGETNKMIGHNMEETVLWYTDDENSDIVRLYKERKQEKMLEPYNGKSKRRKQLA